MATSKVGVSCVRVLFEREWESEKVKIRTPLEWDV